MTFYETWVEANLESSVVEGDPSKTGSPKVRATLYLPAGLLDEARDAAVFLAGYPVRLTLTRLAENALRAELHRLKDLHNKGLDFPPRSEDLKGGRPIAA